MKILKIAGKNITSLSEFSLDFNQEPLKSSSLFAIIGPTGSGKSSILDTLCIALFGKVPRITLSRNSYEGLQDSTLGKIGPADITQMIRKGCREAKALVEFIGKDGCHYRCSWEQKLNRNNNPDQVFSLYNVSKNLVEYSDSKVLQYLSKIELLLGLSYDQFSQTVLLSQGKFADFLKAKEDDKSELLERITGGELYGQISIKVHERQKKEREHLLRIQGESNNLLVLSDEEIELKEKQIIEIKKDLSQNTQQMRESAEKLVKIERLLKLNEENQKKEIELKKYQNELPGLEEKINSTKMSFQLITEEVTRKRPVFQKVRELDAIKAPLEEALKKTKKRISDLMVTDKSLLEQVEQTREELKKSEIQEQDYKQWLSQRDSLRPMAIEWAGVKSILTKLEIAFINYEKVQGQKMQVELGLENIFLELNAIKEKFAEQGIQLRADIETEIFYQQSQVEVNKKRWLEALDFMNHQLKMKRLLQEEVSLNELIPVLQQKYDHAKIELSDLNQMLELIQLTTGKDVEALRHQLKHGEPCLVCGSTEHPYSSGSAKLLTKLDELQEQKKLLDKKLSDCQGDFLKARNKLSLLKESLDIEMKTSTRMKQPIDEIAIAFHAVGETEFNQVYEKSVSELETRLAFLKAIDLDLRRYRLLEQNYQSDKETLRRLQDSFSQLETDKKELLLQLHVIYPAYSLNGLDSSSLGIKNKALEQEILTFLSTQRKLESLLIVKESLNIKLGGYLESASKLALELKSFRESELKEKSDLDILIVDRDKLMPLDKSVDFEEEALELNLLNASKYFKKAEEALAELKELILPIKVLIEKNQQEIESLFLLLEVKEFNVSQMKHQFNYLMELKNQQEQLAENLSGKLAVLNKELTDSQQNRLHLKAIEEKVNIQKIVLEEWTTLNSLIGSNDGKKFRNISQAYALEQLLIEANLQLSQITKRYELIQAPGRVDFLVIDHDLYQERRFTHSLSGGEVFIVSLALALGLSAIASKGLTIETLFIDEGFGTLDPELLAAVMGALTQLQHQGRKVGLITHVEEMKEQIPTRVQLTKLSSGNSKVEILG